MLKKKIDYTSVIENDNYRYLREAAGVAYDKYRESWAATEKLELTPDYPLQLDFELNYSCNFTCSNCTWNIESTGGKGKSTWFPFEEFKRIIDAGIDRGLKCIRLNYINEPLIRKDLYKFIEYAKKSGVIDVYLSTNGSLLTRAASERLIESGLMRLQVSLDAFTEDTFNKIRQGGNFQQVKRNILNFIEMRNSRGNRLPLVRVNFVRTSENEHELDQFKDYWSKIADGIGIQDLVGIMREFKLGSQCGSSHETSSVAFRCSQPFNHLTVRYDGSILPCCSFFGAQLPLGKLRTDQRLSDVENVNNKISDTSKQNDKKISLQEAWDSPEIRELRKIHLNGEYFKNPVCKRCVESSSHQDNTQ